MDPKVLDRASGDEVLEPVGNRPSDILVEFLARSRCRSDPRFHDSVEPIVSKLARLKDREAREPLLDGLERMAIELLVVVFSQHQLLVSFVLQLVGPEWPQASLPEPQPRNNLAKSRPELEPLRDRLVPPIKLGLELSLEPQLELPRRATLGLGGQPPLLEDREFLCCRRASSQSLGS